MATENAYSSGKASQVKNKKRPKDASLAARLVASVSTVHRD